MSEGVLSYRIASAGHEVEKGIEEGRKVRGRARAASNRVLELLSALPSNQPGSGRDRR